MSILEMDELADIFEVSQGVSARLRVDDLRREVLRILEKIFRTNTSSFFLADESGKRIVMDGCVTRNIRKGYIPSYAQYYCRIDPMPNGINQSLSRVLSVVTLDEVIPYKDLIQTEYYNDFYKPQSIYYEMALHLKLGNRMLGAIGLNRPREAVNFSLREKAKAEVMTQIVAGSLAQALSHERLAQSKETKELPSYSCEGLRRFGLTRREVEVVSCVCEGLKNGEIARKLFISEYTVINHLRSVYEKLGISNRTSLILQVVSGVPKTRDPLRSQ